MSVTNPRFSLGVAGAPLPVMAGLAAIGILAAGGYTLQLAQRHRIPLWVPAVLVGGAISNLVDRVVFGAVNDFIATPWIVFNLAVAAGIAGLVLATLTRPTHPERR